MMYSIFAMKPAAFEAVLEGEGTTTIQNQLTLDPQLTGILTPMPEALGDPLKKPEYDLTQDVVVKEIDDSLIARFDLELFKHLKFTAWKKTKLFFEDTFPYITQSIFNPIFKLVYGVVFDLQIKGRRNLKGLKGPTLFISNHIGFYDSFIFDLFVQPFSHFLPFRFMGSRKFIVPMLMVLKMIGLIDLVYFFFGVFRITPGEGAEKSLKKAYEIVRNKGTVVMYPEGKIWRPTHVHPEPIGPFKWGAAILAKNTGVQVIPVSFKKIKQAGKKTILEVNIGKMFFVDQTKKPEEIADDMRGVVVGLYDGTNV
jgi:1-acyl-sn-glycerol-3-phosphate acyltransferase